MINAGSSPQRACLVQREQKQVQPCPHSQDAECLSTSPLISINILTGKAVLFQMSLSLSLLPVSFAALSNLLIYFLGFSKGQEEHETWQSIATEGAIFRVPHAARISNCAKGWVPGSVENAICPCPALAPSWTQAWLLGSFLCGSSSPPLPGRPEWQRHTQHV